MNLQKRTLKKLKKLLIEERWFSNTEFDSLFVHTYLNTKALVLGYRTSIVILMDKRCDVLRISSNSIKETEEEILRAELMLREKLQLDAPPVWREYVRPVLTDEFAAIPPPEYVEYRTFMDAASGTIRTYPEHNENSGENE